MLYKETVTPATLGLLTRLMSDADLASFYLVGGTSMALQVGHRISVDLDLFTSSAFDKDFLKNHLIEHYSFEVDYESKNTLKGEINGVLVDCIAHEYPLVQPIIENEGLRLASLLDIAAMKLNAISGNGTRIKDFIDVAYLSGRYSFNQMLESYCQKYKIQNPIIPVKAITYWEEINFNQPIKMLNNPENLWKKVSKRLLDMQKSPNKIFSSL